MAKRTQSESGFTLVEMLIALVVGSFIALGGFSFLNSVTSTYGLSVSRNGAADEVAELVETLKHVFQERSPLPGYATNPSPAWVIFPPGPNVPPPCQDLTITQVDLKNPATPRITKITTKCGPVVGGWHLQSKLHPDSACALNHSVSVTVKTTEGANVLSKLTYPRGTGIFAIGLCFRNYPGEVGTELAAIAGNDRRNERLSFFLGLSAQDHGTGIVYLPPQ